MILTTQNIADDLERSIRDIGRMIAADPSSAGALALAAARLAEARALVVGTSPVSVSVPETDPTCPVDIST